MIISAVQQNDSVRIMLALILFSIKNYGENSEVMSFSDIHLPLCRNSFSVEIISCQNEIRHSLKSYMIIQRTCLGPVTLSSFQFLPFRMRASVLYLSHHCVLEACNLSSFTGSQLERNFCLRMNHASDGTHT